MMYNSIKQLTTVLYCYTLFISSQKNLIFIKEASMNILINNTSMQPIYEQIVTQIKDAILTGTLKTEEMLPSVRSLSKELNISALTVK